MNQDVSHQELAGTLDLAQAAELCKCSVQLLRRLAQTGAIPATKVGRRWVFSTRLLQGWIDARSSANVRMRAYARPFRGATVTQALIANGAAEVPAEPKTAG
jgi:excisionase family DNA binding protein